MPEVNASWRGETRAAGPGGEVEFTGIDSWGGGTAAGEAGFESNGESKLGDMGETGVGATVVESCEVNGVGAMTAGGKAMAGVCSSWACAGDSVELAG
jgi:hypothetical protein